MGLESEECHYCIVIKRKDGGNILWLFTYYEMHQQSTAEQLSKVAQSKLP